MGIMKSGVQQWVFQRISNAVFVLFGLVLLDFLLKGDFSYETLSGLLSSQGFQIFLAITLVLAAINSVLAGWQIVGDYAKKFNLPPTLMMVVIVGLSAVYLVWGLMLLF